MSYYDVSLLNSDGDFGSRCMACYASEIGVKITPDTQPQNWWSLNSWAVSSAPGFGDAYASALAGNVENPGRDPAVISDAQILSAVQALMAAAPAPEEQSSG